MTSAIDWAIEQQERRMRISLPLGVTEFKNREVLERALDNKSMEAVNRFFSNPSNFDFNSLDFLSEELAEERKVGEHDKLFIQRLVAEIKKTGNYESWLAASVGCLLQVEETLTEMPLKELPKRITMALFFWSYLTVIESAVADLSELFYRIALKKKDLKYTSLYEDLLKKGEHPMFGQLKKAALRWQLIKPQEITFLTSNNLRNQISHANIYYDSKRDKILLPHREELSFQQFEQEYKRIYDFFKELLFKLNDEKSDIKQTADKLRKGMANQYLRLVRSGATKRLWKSTMPWEQKKKQEGK